MARKRGGSGAKNGRDSNPQYLGIKVSGGGVVKAGSILVRQRGTKTGCGAPQLRGCYFDCPARVYHCPGSGDRPGDHRQRKGPGPTGTVHCPVHGSGAGVMILDEIARRTRLRVERAKEAVSQELLREQALGLPAASPEGRDPPFGAAVRRRGFSFICEVKRASPSRGLIAEDFPYLAIAEDYENAGAAAISVLTEPEFFLGKDEYLRDIAARVRVPVLRKDFIIDPYQIYEARLLGASAVLLICALLDSGTLERFIVLAETLGLSALTEVHTEEETAMAAAAGGRIIGINNRDLRTFTVDLQTTLRLRNRIPPGILTVAESGIRSPEDIRVLEAHGLDGVLIGESLMRAPDRKAYLAELRGN